MKKFYISNYSQIKDYRVITNGQEVFSAENNLTFAEFIKSVYIHFDVKYPKFYKMDNICKLAIATSEALLNNTNFITRYKSTDIAVILSNSDATTDTDTNYNKTISDKSNYFPSPTLFVYTLPNIMIGEVCIKNKIKGESAFFVSEKYNPLTLYSHITHLLTENKAESCIAGWVDFTDNKYESILFLVEKNVGNMEFCIENLNKIIE